MARTLADALIWMEHGTELVRAALADLDEPAFDAESALPGWNRRHLTAHLAANARALGNLVYWAGTGERTPMYSSPEQRAADIAAGEGMSGDELREWFDASATVLSDAIHELHAQHWTTRVVTAQGRNVSASETPWLRCREVLVHAVDLRTGLRFRDLPAAFLQALGEDAAAKRSGTGPALVLRCTDAQAAWAVPGSGPPTHVSGSLADVVAYLTGRGSCNLNLDGAEPAPALPPWL